MVLPQHVLPRQAWRGRSRVESTRKDYDDESSTTASASEEEESSNLSFESFDCVVRKVRFDLGVKVYPPRDDLGWNEVQATWLRKKDLILARRRAIRDCVRYQQGTRYREAIGVLRRRLPYMVVDVDVVEQDENRCNLQVDAETADQFETMAKDAAIQIITEEQNARGLERFALGLGPRKEHIFCILETQSMLMNRPFEERAEAVAQASRLTSKDTLDWARTLGLADANDILGHCTEERKREWEVFIPRLSVRAGAQGETVQSLEL